MANLIKDFEFQTQLQISRKEFVTVTICGKYYPNQCTRDDGVNYDIEAILDHKDNDLILAYRTCRFAEGYLSDTIDKATAAHIEYLTGYEAKGSEPNNEGLHPVFESITKGIFPNPTTYPTPAQRAQKEHEEEILNSMPAEQMHEAHAAMFLGNEKDL